jgi:hypothetical protein
LSLIAALTAVAACGGGGAGLRDGPGLDVAPISERGSPEGGAPDAGRDGDPPDGAAVPPDGGVAEVGLDAEGAGSDGPAAPACPVTPPGSRFASWKIPHPAGTEGAGNPHSYDTSAADVVVDRVTGLTWQRRVDAVSRSWVDATGYCACLALGGHEDWRLPTRMELVSIVDFSRHSPAVDVEAFPDTPGAWFWTSSRWADDPTFAWYLYFENGFSNFNDQEATYRVRCVREPPARPDAPAQRYTVSGGTVLDAATGLTWQQAVDETGRTWVEAKAHCAALDFAGGGWRLPSMKELQSLVDDSLASPAIDAQAFPATPLEPFWTATPVVQTPGSAWRVSFVHGYTYDASDYYPYLARCVR